MACLVILFGVPVLVSAGTGFWLGGRLSPVAPTEHEAPAVPQDIAFETGHVVPVGRLAVAAGGGGHPVNLIADIEVAFATADAADHARSAGGMTRLRDGLLTALADAALVPVIAGGAGPAQGGQDPTAQDHTHLASLMTERLRDSVPGMAAVRVRRMDRTDLTRQ